MQNLYLISRFVQPLTATHWPVPINLLLNNKLSSLTYELCTQCLVQRKFEILKKLQYCAGRSMRMALMSTGLQTVKISNYFDAILLVLWRLLQRH